MDKAGMKIFDELMIKRSEKYLSNFPQSIYEDRINELVWGVKSKTCNPKHIYNFVIANVKNSHKLLVKSTITPFNWEEYFTGILKNPGLMCEYFMVDYMSRNSHDFEHYRNKRFKFVHKKGSPEQDEALKIDFLTTMITKNKDGINRGINFGVQLTTAKSRAELSKKKINGLDWVGNKKGDIMRTMSKIEEGSIDNYPPSYSPDTMCLLVINSSINEFININNINIFKNAFATWQDEGLLPGGPTQYLNNMVRVDFERIADGYHLGLEILYKLVSKALPNNRDFKNIDKYDNFDILFDYNAAKKELKMDYFLKDGSFLMSLFFVINQKLINIINS